MQIYGYHRTSTKEQHLDRGIQEIERYCNEHEMALTNIFTDQETGKNFNRPRYTVLVEDVLRPGDILIITELDRLGRNKRDTMQQIQRFIHYGNFIGDTIKIAADLEIKAVTLGIMIGKAVKLAEGNLDTHSKQVTMNKDFLREVALSAGCGGETLAVIEKITLARELWTLLSAEDLQAFCSRLLELCHQYCDPLLPEGELTILLISEEGKIIT